MDISRSTIECRKYDKTQLRKIYFVYRLGTHKSHVFKIAPTFLVLERK